jgi:hypothetical protein
MQAMIVAVSLSLSAVGCHHKSVGVSYYRGHGCYGGGYRSACYSSCYSPVYYRQAYAPGWSRPAAYAPMRYTAPSGQTTSYAPTYGYSAPMSYSPSYGTTAPTTYSSSYGNLPPGSTPYVAPGTTAPGGVYQGTTGVSPGASPPSGTRAAPAPGGVVNPPAPPAPAVPRRNP